MRCRCGHFRMSEDQEACTAYGTSCVVSRSIPLLKNQRAPTFSSGLWASHRTTSCVKLPRLESPPESRKPVAERTRKYETTSLSRPFDQQAPAAEPLPSGESAMRPGESSACHMEKLLQQTQGSVSHVAARAGCAVGASTRLSEGQESIQGLPSASSFDFRSTLEAENSSAPETMSKSVSPKDKSPVQRRVSARTWSTLLIRQQPEAARACGFGERDRRVIDPPPVLELGNTADATMHRDTESLQTTLCIVHASLWDEGGRADITYTEPRDRKPGPSLMGTTVVTRFKATDENAKPGTFFAFPDLSCRMYGRYRLRFALVEIDPASVKTGSSSPVVAHALSEVFTVYTARDFPGMRPSTPLTMALREHGLGIPVKNGKRLAKGKLGQLADDRSENEEAMRCKRRRCGR